MMHCYFAHPVTSYNTPEEAAAIAAIQARGWSVVNPNSPAHEAEYKRQGMGYFFALVDTCDVLTFMRFPNGAIGAGVGGEIDRACARGTPIFEAKGRFLWASPADDRWPVLSIEDTRALIKRLGRTCPARPMRPL